MRINAVVDLGLRGESEALAGLKWLGDMPCCTQARKIGPRVGTELLPSVLWLRRMGWIDVEIDPKIGGCACTLVFEGDLNHHGLASLSGGCGCNDHADGNEIGLAEIGIGHIG